MDFSSAPCSSERPCWQHQVYTVDMVRLSELSRFAFRLHFAMSEIGIQGNQKGNQLIFYVPLIFMLFGYLQYWLPTHIFIKKYIKKIGTPKWNKSAQECSSSSKFQQNTNCEPCEYFKNKQTIKLHPNGATFLSALPRDSTLLAAHTIFHNSIQGMIRIYTTGTLILSRDLFSD